MRDKINVDVGVGDIVVSEVRYLQLVEHRGIPLFERDVSLTIYPPESIFAEKLETLVKRGSLNSRMKDFHDLYLLGQSLDVLDFEKLAAAIRATFEWRGTGLLLPLDFDASEYDQLQRLWSKHRAGLGDVAKRLDLPPQVNEVLAVLNRVLSQIGLLRRE